MNLWRIFVALARCAIRDTRSLGSVQGNNLLYFFALVTYQQAESAYFLWTIMGMLLVLPALAAPVAKLPELRLGLWPVSKGQSRLLRVFIRPALRAAPRLWRVPGLEARQLLQTLDVYAALVLAVGGTAYRVFAAEPEPEANGVISLLVVICLSTLAQNLFTLDGPARLRWQQSSRPGYVHLWRKGRWLLGLAMVLSVGLSPLTAATGMLICLAVGHHNSVLAMTESAAWRFSSGQFIPHGLLQVGVCFACGIPVSRGDWRFLAGALVAYLASLFLYGWIMERS